MLVLGDGIQHQLYGAAIFSCFS